MNTIRADRKGNIMYGLPLVTVYLIADSIEKYSLQTVCNL
jgi:hypothetical protein